jgi:phage-related protein
VKTLHWISSGKKDLEAFPREVRQEAGYSLHLAQCGESALGAVAMVGFGGANVIEVVIDHDRNTYRAVYTVKFAEAIYVLHAFQKKSKKGIATPKQELDLIKTRLKAAEEHYERTYESDEARRRKGPKGRH